MNASVNPSGAHAGLKFEPLVMSGIGRPPLVRIMKMSRVRFPSM
jgi:hypothetical protein